jgi:hypothetical protein
MIIEYLLLIIEIWLLLQDDWSRVIVSEERTKVPKSQVTLSNDSTGILLRLR